MHKFLLPLVVLGMFSGCCSTCCKSSNGKTPPPLNCMGLPYDGAGSPCYRPRGPWWCCLPGPCSTCRDPWVYYYDTSCKADCIGRHVCNDCDTRDGIVGYPAPEPQPVTAPPGPVISMQSAEEE